MAFYAPVTLLALLPTWLILVWIGYAGMFWAVGVPTWYQAFRDSGSSLLTLGFAPVEGAAQTLLAFSEATVGLILIALLIAYLPTIYSAFQRREAAVNLLEVRAGKPPSAVEMIERYHRIHGLDRLDEQWQAWEAWFADIEESHTSLAALVFFRSPRPDHSWITAAGAVLDAAALSLSALDIPSTPQAALCIRAGFIALRRIADVFGIAYTADPHYPEQPISVRRDEFDAVCDRLAAEGAPLKADREQAWRDFAGWRVNYDTVLLALCSITMAPPAAWSSDRAPAFRTPAVFAKRPLSDALKQAARFRTENGSDTRYSIPKVYDRLFEGLRCLGNDDASPTAAKMLRCRSGRNELRLILDDDPGIRVLGRHGQALLTQQGDVLLHTPASLVQTILNRMPNSGEALKIGRVEAEEVRFRSGLDHQRIIQSDHLIPPSSYSLDPRGFEDRLARPGRHFLCAVIVNPDQLIPSRLGIVTNRTLLLDEPELVLLQNLHQFTEPHGSPRNPGWVSSSLSK